MRSLSEILKATRATCLRDNNILWGTTGRSSEINHVLVQYLQPQAYEAFTGSSYDSSLVVVWAVIP